MQDENKILIPTPALFSFEECVWFLDRNYDDCLHVIKEQTVYKSIHTGNDIVLVGIEQNGSFLEADIIAGPAGEAEKNLVVAYIREWFDMDRDIEPFYHLLQTDGRLSYMAERYKGLRLMGIANLFEAICWSIIGQQINLAFAYKVKRSLIERFGEGVTFENETFYTFPEPSVLADVQMEELKSMQFSRQKAEYLINTAKAFRDGLISREMLAALPDFEARTKALTALKGIGAWTANYVLMKSMREPGGIPHGDIGLLNALESHNIIHDRKEQERINALFSAFEGWESYLVFYLWRSLTVRQGEPA
ncbi:DNA-3-methyladenine glycosylase family protein [Dyadobacter sandarakinus]|uniref:DNA-3-methyladenine glycosylase II n=1 Tax=Dyadobacter sandarakinus TaxID=2747268 RepID=A0ABX7I3N0_9BACT|nr:DNA-3-methyladenine glycosylase 2 family protein [Dyadobacter sandarakinus]QRR00434.1 DNA-3-methyladenine glycosylase 2 family protein [Dyadobacter sandarakinus]